MAKDHRQKEALISSSLRFRMPSYSHNSTGAVNANEWFADKFPDATQQYGPAFMEATVPDVDGVARFIPAYLNEDFMAAMLGGDKRLGHQVVWCHQEETFYFYDCRVDAFCPTTEEKLKLLLSNYLIRCSQECGALVDITNLVVKFRQDDVLTKIVTKAKAVLEADSDFFSGKDGKRRMVNGKVIDPNEEPTYMVFVKRGIVRQPEAKLTVADAFHRYYKFCKDSGNQPLTKAEFKSLVAEVIREEFKIGLRHDIPNQDGKLNHGWLGIDCRMEVGRN